MSSDKRAMSLIQMLDSMSDGASLIDANGNILFANNSLLSALGETTQGMVGTNASDLTLSKRTNICLFHKTLKARKKVTAPQLYTNTDGEQFSINITQTPIFDESGELEYVIGINRDIKKLPSKQTVESSQYYVDGPVIYKDEKMKKILIDIRKIAPYPLNIMLVGETGVGKDVLASFVHEVGTHSSGPYVAINCAALPENLIESELFGYERGAFTGALSQGKEGLIESANGGTLFLNEVNSLPLSVQGKLLTVLEEKKVRRIGSTKSHDVDFQLISATNQDLNELIKAKAFRSDLYYRLNTITVTIPPLRKRSEDIVALAAYFVQVYSQKYKKNISLSSHYFDFLSSYTWPGNVRELKSFIERLVVTTSQTEDPILKDITVTGLPLPTAAPPAKSSESVSLKFSGGLEKQLEQYESALLEQTISKCKNLREVAETLEIPPSTLTRKMKKYGLKAK